MVLRLRLALLLLAGFILRIAVGQTLYGPGGLIINPTAYNDHAGFIGLNASFFNRQPVEGTNSFYPISATYAFTDRFEVGGLYLGEVNGTSREDEGGLFFKQGLLAEGHGRPAVAFVGTTLTGFGTTSTGTFVASKEVFAGTHLHLGARALTRSYDTRADGNLIIGTDIQFAKSFKLIAEADSRLRAFQYGSTAFGIQYAGPVITTVGLVSQATNRYNFFVGIGYPIGKP